MSNTSLPIPPNAAARSSGSGAFHFVNNLTPSQRQHLQFTIPAAHIPTRFSQFLEGPRRTPVPQKFHFDALDSEKRRARHAGGRLDHIAEEKKEGKVHGRFGSLKSSKTGSKSKIDEEKRDYGSAKSSIELKEVLIEKSSEGRDAVEWRFYATGICLCLLNLVAAWDATALSLALPVSFPS